MPTRNKRHWSDALVALGACLEAVEWAKSQKIRRLISLAYHRGMRRGVSVVWEMSQPLRPVTLNADSKDTK